METEGHLEREGKLYIKSGDNRNDCLVLERFERISCTRKNGDV